ncbi:phage major tail tube protein [Tistrella mobilis]|uniref:phage major tail tube protein n=1 Tax=Tistrella mobilis TaxID=171437 RepID=UPI0035562AD9
MIPKILKNFNLFVDGRGYAGRVDEVQLPELSVQTEEHRAGGMDAPAAIDMGLDALTAQVTFAEHAADLYRLWGLSEGASVPWTFRGALVADDNTVTPMVAVMRGQITKLASGSAKVGSKAGPQATLALRYYRLDIDGTTVIEIDVANMVRRVGGQDRLQAVRTALGI